MELFSEISGKENFTPTKGKGEYVAMINAYMIQLFVPLNFLGFIYREISEALTNIERLFGLLDEPRKIADAPDAKPLAIQGGAVSFEQVCYAYDAQRPQPEAPPGSQNQLNVHKRARDARACSPQRGEAKWR